MKKILSLLVLLILFVSCKEEVVAKPDRLIEKNKMIDIMYDLAILEGIKYQNPSSLDSNKINSADYIYQKYQIDSTQLAQSNIYYAADYVEYKNMYDLLTKRMEQKKKVAERIVALEKKRKTKKEATKVLKTKVTVKKDSILNKKVVPKTELKSPRTTFRVK